ncbi:MAG: molybdate ABC transporter substrate-binding protein [Erysipelotrichaceae bacterium]|uniref:molybdate ABC transporter substrate-binding protein n=1 Tax=Floccifex sp. TaxID=2815810 RepID=UPI002A7570F7|nr:molybdate ABC transporter substrate-binding protein [Floccifex sp.]MDD7281369.1 molybdate ABC transporter substrate-binding protein [Erysipelotrichaceae bacterium]MDY2958892.1 molybdate ABC transporter substrate-binding protein [Floccifex sp.]
MKKILLSLCMFLSLCACSPKQEEVTITLAAAASLENAFEEEIIPAIEELYPNVTIEGVYDSSGKLQMQIESGLNADIFFSAATKQMNTLVDEDYIQKDHVVNLLENKLVLIKGKGSQCDVTELSNIQNADMIALGDSEIVPAGQYAKEALTNLNVWDAIQNKVSFASNVTEVLSWVESGSAQVGIVYKTDAISSDKIEIIEECDSSLLQSPVIYPVASLNDNEMTKKVLDYICSQDALDVFRKYGFNVYEEN